MIEEFLASLMHEVTITDQTHEAQVFTAGSWLASTPDAQVLKAAQCIDSF
jgi:hypothetical protein